METLPVSRTGTSRQFIASNIPIFVRGVRGQVLHCDILPKLSLARSRHQTQIGCQVGRSPLDQIITNRL
jgi:hypothetical protein